jgi:type II secretory pathway component PulF
MGRLSGFPLKKKAIFFRQAATMISSGLAIDRAVSTAGLTTLPEAAKISRAITSGSSLSKAMSAYPWLFSEYEIAILNTGETSGTLDRQLQVLADELEQNYRLLQTLKSKLAYPILVAHVAVFVPPLVVLVMQGLKPYLQLTLGTLLPVYLVMGLAWLIHRLSSQGSLRYLLDTALSLTPILGNVLRLLALVRFTRAMSHLLEAGTLPYHALQLASRACGNSVVESHLYTSFNKLGKDARASEWMQRSGQFNPTIVSLVASGEETGAMAAMFGKAAELLEMEFRDRVHLVMTVLPVLMLLGVGVLVGWRCVNILGGYIKLLSL